MAFTGDVTPKHSLDRSISSEVANSVSDHLIAE